MIEDWLDILQTGKYKISLPKLSVTSDEIETLNGSGHITWNAGAGIRIQAITDGAEILLKLLSGGFGVPGQLISHSKFLSFSGQTNDNWNFTAIPTPRDGFNIHSNLPTVVWDLNTLGFTLQKNSSLPTLSSIRILMGPDLRGWARFTATEVSNEVFGGQYHSRDWLVAECGIGRVAAQRKNNEWFEVRVIPKDVEVHDSRKLCAAISRALGFIIGRRCIIKGYEETDGKTIKRHLDIRRHETSSNSLLQPIGMQLEYLQNIEKLLGLAIDFFLTEIGEKAAAFLFLCWDTADNSHLTQLAINSICVEGLIRLAAEQYGPFEAQVDDSDLAAFQKWLATKPADFSQQFLSRLGGLPGMFKNMSASDIFRYWIHHNLLNVTREDCNAWSETRNPSAHGRLAEAANQKELQARVIRQHRVQNLMNKLILQLMGYQGVYIDYSQVGFQASEFPHIPKENMESSDTST